jgi:hypothetical protein
MKKTKFTVRVDPHAFEAAKQYARNHDTTVTDLVEEFFRSLSKAEQVPIDTPVLNELAGSLSQDVSLDDYRAYLEEKYLGRPRKDD